MPGRILGEGDEILDDVDPERCGNEEIIRPLVQWHAVRVLTVEQRRLEGSVRVVSTDDEPLVTVRIGVVECAVLRQDQVAVLRLGRDAGEEAIALGRDLFANRSGRRRRRVRATS